MFEGRRLVIATKHGKEAILAPILERELGVHCFTLPHFDSDIFGTFSGEVERLEDPVFTARLKCEKAMEMAHCDLAIASEGSFGSHPSFYFLPADDEVILLLDKKHDASFLARELSIDTNFNAAEISTFDELIEFSKRSKFPTHGLILRKSKTRSENIIKGITDWPDLKESFEKLIKGSTSLFIETDMRAMHNPSRMKVISKAAEKLVGTLKSTCPSCHFPGFSVVKMKEGLPCELCQCPTRSIISHIYKCQKCLETKEILYPNHKMAEDPAFCDYCNP
jgi:hypothetical protein